MELIDYFFLISFFIWIVLGYAIYNKFYISIEEVMATTEIKKSQAVMHRADQLQKLSRNSIFFCIFLSIGINLMALQTYSWITSIWPVFSYNLFLLCAVFTIIIYPLGELAFLSDKESEAETPYHQVLRKIIRKLIGKVKGKTEAITVFCLVFYLIPILILFYGLHLPLLFTVFIIFMIYPLIIVAYNIGYTIFRLLSPAIFLHNVKNIRLFVGLSCIGVIILFEISLFIQNLNLIFISLLAFLMVIIYGVIKELKYRPGELTHIIDDIMRPFEYIHGAFLILCFGVFTFLAMPSIFINVNFLMVPLTSTSIINIVILIQSCFIPIFLIASIINKRRSPSRTLVVALSRDSMKLNAAIKSRFINDKTVVDSLEKSINQGYIRPEYTPKLHRLLNNEDTHVRRKSIVLLRKITEDDRFKSVSIIPNLLNFLRKDKIWTVRLEAAESLTQMMKILPRVEVLNILKALSELAADKNRYVRWGIIKLYNSIALAQEDKIQDILPFLVSGLKDEEWSVRKGTVESFNQLLEDFPDFAAELLGRSLELLADEDLDIVKEVFTLIQRVTGIAVNSDTLEELKNEITEKISSDYSLDPTILEQAIERVAEATKPKKFIFKKDDLSA